MKQKKEIYKVCFECGKKYGDYVAGVSSVWQSTCDICGKQTGVTEIRDFNYIPLYGVEEKKLKARLDEIKRNIKFCKKCGEYMYVPEDKKRHICSNPMCPIQLDPVCEDCPEDNCKTRKKKKTNYN